MFHECDCGPHQQGRSKGLRMRRASALLARFGEGTANAVSDLGRGSTARAAELAGIEFRKDDRLCLKWK
jgi:hypothetical protein